MITARFTGPIASAVAGEITRLSQHPDFGGEGAAYKAAWDRLADDAGKLTGVPAYARHCEAHRRDCVMSSLVVAWFDLPLQRRALAEMRAEVAE